MMNTKLKVIYTVSTPLVRVHNTCITTIVHDTITPGTSTVATFKTIIPLFARFRYVQNRALVNAFLCPDSRPTHSALHLQDAELGADRLYKERHESPKTKLGRNIEKDKFFTQKNQINRLFREKQKKSPSYC